ncbi:MAG TPA: phosphate ABC transporter substrate-binding protein PstS [Elusimicrobia bacterium]|nr:MAG: phosphate ABC transporter substrate-binding protein PstS [Elusimicrobia bacterium GWA2_66_18]OGR70152.1 MAG: phosphate ABC transporter substrate-binding protein PstS [Elusimicrobia bacterium GWC2_65_9]HAZ08797.1 phosphate ABC transporter substrate-binding protein PstS [Elusimicrobiota bacterium]
MNSTLNLIAVAVLFAAPAAAQMKTLNGAGATFPYPIYSKWFDEYHKVKPDLQINYQSIGSGGGIRQITERTVDFGATDGPMTNQRQFKVDGKILHIPTVLGAVVPAYNLKDIADLRLSGPVLADIFLGKITRWTDPAIAKLNENVKLPDAAITVVHRSDGSGTTYCFVDYLSKVSAEWKKKVGTNTAVNWPVGLGGKGNEGVAGLVKQTPNALGYIELIYAKQNDIFYASVQNKAGKLVKASIESITAAADAAAKSMPKDYRVSITDAAGEGAYPISTFTWLLIYERNGEGKGQVLKGFLRWMLKDGQGMTNALGYAPLPASVNAMVGKTIEGIQ